MRSKHENIQSDSFFYAFVDLEPHAPNVFIIPSKVVADVLNTAHQAWLDEPGRGGKPHRDHDMRRLLPAYARDVPGYPPGWLEPYRERWDLLRPS